MIGQLQATAACKVCGATGTPFGSTDFNRSCEDAKGRVLPISATRVSYLRCGHCGLIFTPDFDAWSRDDFGREIYNDGYSRVDPDYEATRPLIHAKMIGRELGSVANGVSLLDYGGGNGLFARTLRAEGFARSETYDPFHPDHEVRPAAAFDIITCFETLEHLPDPRTTMGDLLSFLDPAGLVFFSTLVQPANVDMRWWYIGPRNGHITFYTEEALRRLWAGLGKTFVSFNENYHAAFSPERPPAFAEALLRKARA